MNFLVVDTGIRIFGAMVFACHSIQSRGVDFVLSLPYISMILQDIEWHSWLSNRISSKNILCRSQCTHSCIIVLFIVPILYIKNVLGFTSIVPGVIVFSSVLKKSSITIYCYCGSFKTNFSKSVIIQRCKKQLHSQISNNFFYWQRHCCF